MSFITDHLLRITDTFEGLEPLPAFLRGYFKQYPKLGSRDRRALSEAAYIYYRCRRFYPAAMPTDMVVKNGYALCHSTNAFLAKMLGITTDGQSEAVAVPEIVSPVGVTLSDGIADTDWLASLWNQPRLFIRIRKDREAQLAIFERESIAYEVVAIPGNEDQDCISLPNSTAVDKLLPEDAYVVQDLSSQTSMYQVMQATGKPARVWDVCSGAGGKSILLRDKWPAFLLTASDIRDTILHNLKMRFRLYNLPKPRTIVTDTTNAIGLQTALGEEVFNLVLCDVPCSGSGTWARTPEQFYFFRAAQLKRFEELQYNITLNASKHVAKGGFLAYVTCSVFRNENEDIVAKIEAKTGLECIQQGIINGIGQQADCMFVALFKNN